MSTEAFTSDRRRFQRFYLKTKSLIHLKMGLKFELPVGAKDGKCYSVLAYVLE